VSLRASASLRLCVNFLARIVTRYDTMAPPGLGLMVALNSRAARRPHQTALTLGCSTPRFGRDGASPIGERLDRKRSA